MTTRAALLALLGCAAALLVAASTASADTYHVLADGSGDLPKIQDAIDVAVSGDHIVLGDGTFLGARNRDLQFLGKNLTLRSANGNPALCAIDCQGQSRGLSIRQGETAAVVEGITIRDGFAPAVGGPPASPGVGGGIVLMNVTATIRNCVITGCSADDAPGGALAAGAYSINSTVTLEDCAFIANSFALRGTGAGLFAWGNSNVTATRCRFVDNHAPGATSGGSGGGIRAQDSRLTLIDCEVIGNTAGTGAGISTGQFCLVDFRNCLVAGNLSTPSTQGTSIAGGIQFGYDTDGSVESCTITGNRASNHGGGISVANDCNLTITNSILWGNCSGPGTGESAYILPDGSVGFSCSDVDPATVLGGIVTYSSSLAVDPQFCDPRSCANAPTLEGAYTLLPASPLLDAAGCGRIGSEGSCGIVGIPWGSAVAQGLRIRSAPNPSRGAVSLQYAIPEAGTVRIEIFDAAGRVVARLDEGRREAGSHSVTWNGGARDGRPVAAGRYFARVHARGRSAGAWIVRVE